MHYLLDVLRQVAIDRTTQKAYGTDLALHRRHVREITGSPHLPGSAGSTLPLPDGFSSFGDMPRSAFYAGLRPTVSTCRSRQPGRRLAEAEPGITTFAGALPPGFPVLVRVNAGSKEIIYFLLARRQRDPRIQPRPGVVGVTERG